MEREFSAGIIVYREDSARMFLLLKTKSGGYDLPKGHIEKGENSVEAAKRETKEEAGIDVTPIRGFEKRIRYVFTEENAEALAKRYEKTDKGVLIFKTVTYFLAKSETEQEVKVSSEHAGHEWMTYQDCMEKLKYKNQINLIKGANDYVDRMAQMKQLNEEYAKVPEGVPAWDLSRKLVPGEGPLDAKVMFIGQAPGRFEDQEGRPFIGAAGKLLTRLIGRARMRRSRAYITSVVQFFPPENRLPTDEETELCMPFLERQISIVKPKLIVLMGNFAATNVAGVGNVVANHGKEMKSQKYGCDVYITLHPAAAVRIKANMPTIEQDFDKLYRIVARMRSRNDRKQMKL